MRSVAEGAAATSKLQHGRQHEVPGIDEAAAPCTTLRVVPLPRFTGADARTPHRYSLSYSPRIMPAVMPQIVRPPCSKA